MIRTIFGFILDLFYNCSLLRLNLQAPGFVAGIGKTLNLSQRIGIAFFQIPRLARGLQVDPRDAISYKRGLFLFSMALILNSCGISEIHKEFATKANEAQVKEFKEAEAALKKGKIKTAITRFNKFIEKNPNIDITNDALYNLAQIYFDQGDYLKAAHYWQSVVESPNFSPLYDKSVVKGAEAFYQMGLFEDASQLFTRFRIRDNSEPEFVANAMELLSKLKLQKGDSLGSLQDLMKAREFKINPADKQAILTRAIEIINSSFTQSQIESILSGQKLPDLDMHLRYRLAVILYETKSWSSARTIFQDVGQKYTQTEQGKRAQQFVAAIDAQEKTDSAVIGAVLPLSGKYAQMGYKTLRGIELGLGLYNKNLPTPVKLAIIDSEGNPDVARRGAEKLVSEDHAIAIIGDILSKTAQAVAIKSQELGIPCITLSQKQGLIDIGEFIFRNVLTPDRQMKSLVDFAMDQKSYKKFAIIFPNDSYGTEYASAFWDYVLLKGGQVTAAQTYPPEEKDFRNVVQRLAGTFYAEEDRGKELKLRYDEWAKDQKQRALHDKLPKELLPPVVDFDAIFIPDTPDSIGQIAPMLAYNDVDKIPLLGTNIWNAPKILEKGGKYVENSIFIDDYFSEDQSPSMKKYSSEFQSQFSYKPSVFEAQGYDAAVLISQVLRNYNFSVTRKTLRESLVNASNVQGATGLIRMTPQREVEKSLVPLTINKGQIVKLDTRTEAPR